MNERANLPPRARESRPCANCGADAVCPTSEVQPFAYGAGEEAVQLEVEVPVWRCSKCGFAYTEGDAEALRHDAVCRHLRVLTPREIRSFRERLGLTRTELVRLTGFGEASIKRWESGALVQSISADRFLRLIDDGSTLARLRSLVDGGSPRRASGVFRTEHSPEEKRRSLTFELCRATG